MNYPWIATTITLISNTILRSGVKKTNRFASIGLTFPDTSLVKYLDLLYHVMRPNQGKHSYNSYSKRDLQLLEACPPSINLGWDNENHRELVS